MEVFEMSQKELHEKDVLVTNQGAHFLYNGPQIRETAYETALKYLIIMQKRKVEKALLILN